jgi:hypothetical protein
VKEGTPLDYDQWVHGVRDGRSYVGDGLSHLFDFTVGGLGVGEKGDAGAPLVSSRRRREALKVTDEGGRAARRVAAQRHPLQAARPAPLLAHVERAASATRWKVPES